MLILNPDFKIDFQRIGNEEQPLLVIDDLLLNPDELVEFAATSQWFEPKETYYPGLNAKLPPSYYKIIDGLRGQISNYFNIEKKQKLNISGFLGLTTLAFEYFDPWQKIPHYDRAEFDHLAMVHYLNKNQTGGTGFFRHIPTGFESISPNRSGEYLELTTQWIKQFGNQLVDYAGINTPNYELFHKVSFKYNRIVIYPSYVLHCALYDATNHSSDVRNGRLTANNFILPYF